MWETLTVIQEKGPLLLKMATISLPQQPGLRSGEASWDSEAKDEHSVFDTTGKGVWTRQEKGEPARLLLQKHLWEIELLCLCMKAVRYEALCGPKRTKIDAYQSTHQKLWDRNPAVRNSIPSHNTLRLTRSVSHKVETN